MNHPGCDPGGGGSFFFHVPPVTSSPRPSPALLPLLLRAAPRHFRRCSSAGRPEARRSPAGLSANSTPRDGLDRLWKTRGGPCRHSAGLASRAERSRAAAAIALLWRKCLQFSGRRALRPGSQRDAAGAGVDRCDRGDKPSAPPSPDPPPHTHTPTHPGSCKSRRAVVGTRCPDWSFPP